MCDTCANTHYLNAQSNRCELRIISPAIEFCSLLNPAADNCLECQVSYQITDDKRKCLSVLNDCLDYNDSTLNNTALTCKTCNLGFYLISDLCTAGTVPDCKQYNVNSEICVLCNDKFYLDNQSKCQPHTAMELCKSYSTNQANRCLSCEGFNYLFEQIRGCEPIATTIAQCSAYSDKNTCSACNLGFVLNNNACVDIPSNENCLAKTGADCTNCKPNYYIKAGSCKALTSIIIDNCEAVVDDSNSCSLCKHNSVPFNQINLFSCLKIGEETPTGTVSGINDCLKIEGSNCEQCKSGFYTQKNENDCDFKG